MLQDTVAEQPTVAIVGGCLAVVRRYGTIAGKIKKNIK